MIHAPMSESQATFRPVSFVIAPVYRYELRYVSSVHVTEQHGRESSLSYVNICGDECRQCSSCFLS